MLEQLKQIDTSVIDELMEIKRERETVADRLAKMEAEKAKVSDVVYRRVKRDYETKSTALERKAAPLKDKARQEYAKLKTLLDKIGSQHASTQLDREEVEFRHRLGEFAEGEYEKKVDDLDGKLEEQKAQLAEAQEVKEAFVEAFDSEEELALPVVAAPAPVPAPVPAAVPAPTPSGAQSMPEMEARSGPAAPATDLGRTTNTVPLAADPAITAPQPVQAPAPVPPTPAPAKGAPAPPVLPLPAPDSPHDGTMILTPEPPRAGGSTQAAKPQAAAASPAAQPASPPASVEGPPVGKTVVLTLAKLVAIDADLGAPEFPLQPLTFVGRTPDNQVRLNKPAVSRRHAQLTQGEKGWMLKDLHSENGTYVNGEKVGERALADGDRVQFGTVRLVFRGG